MFWFPALGPAGSESEFCRWHSHTRSTKCAHRRRLPRQCLDLLSIWMPDRACRSSTFTGRASLAVPCCPLNPAWLTMDSDYSFLTALVTAKRRLANTRRQLVVPRLLGHCSTHWDYTGSQSWVPPVEAHSLCLLPPTMLSGPGAWFYSVRSYIAGTTQSGFRKQANGHYRS